MTKNSFKHSGTLGDLIYSLPIVKHFGGGDFYLHLDQIDYLSQSLYGVKAPEFHSGRMNQRDFDFMKSFMEEQPYINKFEVLDPRSTEITHNLDRFRTTFVNHPGNYVDCYANTFGLTDPVLQKSLRQTPWLSTNSPIVECDIVINRTKRWVPDTLNPIWNEWRDNNMEKRSVFVGLADEHEHFQKVTGWEIHHAPTSNLMGVFHYIAGAGTFIGNQSVALSLAIGMGHKDIWCEARRDLPIERNECYFPQQLGIHYF